jgi:hypothetical protein
MKSFLVIITTLLLSAAAVPMQAAAQSTPTVAEQYLFTAANHERAQQGLPALRWDDKLYRAADAHAVEMVQRESISHQYPGEPDISARVLRAGAHFSVVAENVAEAPTAVRIHDAWMQSPGHRANLLDPRLDAVGIRVLSRDGQLYAVEDFDRSVAMLSLEQQETAVATLLESKASVTAVPSALDARRTCAMDTGYAGTAKPWFVMRYTAADVNELPPTLQAKLATGKFHRALVGACPATDTQNFTAYNIAVLLYP